MAFYLRPSFRRGSDSHRQPPAGATTYGAGYWPEGAFRFIASAPLVMHDACATTHDVSGHPCDEGRDAFSALAGGDLCWSPLYSDQPDAPACFYCGEAVQGRG